MNEDNVINFMELERGIDYEIVHRVEELGVCTLCGNNTEEEGREWLTVVSDDGLTTVENGVEICKSCSNDILEEDLDIRNTKDSELMECPNCGNVARGYTETIYANSEEITINPCGCKVDVDTWNEWLRDIKSSSI